MVGHSEEQVETIMSNVLRWGIIVTSIIVFFGAVIFLFTEGMDIPSYQHFNHDSIYSTPSSIFAEVLAFNSLGIIQLGILLLVCVPIVRVAVSIFTFSMQKDTFYAIVSLIVLAILVYSFATTL